MKRWVRVAILLGVGLAGCITLAGIALMLLIGQGEAPRSIRSPDGRRTLLVEIEQSRADRTKYKCVKFAVKDASGRMEFEAQTGASHFMRWSLDWAGSDRIVLRSSDIGGKAWARDSDGHWHAEPASVSTPD